MGSPQINSTIPAPALMYARLLRENDDLIVQGKGDSTEAETLADRMDGSWYAMSAKERQRMRGLSADLYILREGGPKRVPMSQDELVAWQEAARSAWAQSELGDVDAALDFLRQPIPATLPRHIVPFLQARCWDKLGDLETALSFMKEAERTDPAQTLSVLTLLQQLGEIDDSAAYTERIRDRQTAGSGTR